jgi:tRNA wybutosine-synthesizing protein 4
MAARRSAASLGYFDDRFIALMVPKGRRRSPVINRGYFSRVAGIEEVIKQFLGIVRGAGGAAVPQIVSLGAGLDTTFFKLRVCAVAAAAPLLS